MEAPVGIVQKLELEDVLDMIHRLEGDVRILKLAVERACTFDEPRAAPAPLDAVERDHILDVLRQAHGNRMAAARMLGISRRSLYRRLERHHIDHGPHVRSAGPHVRSAGL
ncbi:MAG TPA: helix-turn-helix domain-containing protein [Vicinamibacterales bacterium]|nr:helix-turn-helix domain-containing protein [Vicinamibacterales bacterium]